MLTPNYTTYPAGQSPIFQQRNNDFRTAGNALGALAGNLMAGNPGDAANQYLNQIQPTITPYYQPYITAGTETLPKLQEQYNTLTTDPSSLYDKFAGGYEASPYYKYQYDQATKAANQAAAAGGMVGSPQEQQQLAETVSSLAGKDFYNYLSQILQMYNRGLTGQEGINQMGYNASNELATNLADALINQSKAAYSGTANEGESLGGSLGALGSALATFLF
jgi:hypothetical protein